ncbi:MAG: dihydropteroate synthase [Verrucomicrobiota bacterium]|jgi:dihydropteroate synthase
MRLRLPDRVIPFPRRPLIMGIVNVNDDSFSGDGTLDFDAAIDQAREQISHGADVIDVGAESARTNRAAVTIDEEVRRFGGFLDRWENALGDLKPKDADQIWPPILSANTWRPEVVREILPSKKVELLNDMSALPDDTNAQLCAKHETALLIMHSVGEPKVPYTHQQWADVMKSMDLFFEEKIALALEAGVDRDALVLDPGIDFAKQRDDNLKVMRELSRLHKFERPILAPVSRKRVIGEVLGLADPMDRDAGTIACIAACLQGGANILRVHHVAAGWQSVKVLHALEKARG